MKRILVLSVSLLAASFANASYLLWQVDTTDYSSISGTVNQYQLWATDGTTATKLQTTATAGSPNKYDISSTYAADNYSFYVELANFESAGNVTTVAKSGTVSYADLSTHIVTTLSSVPSVTPWHAQNYESVPEPTTGLLLLIGLSLVSLKRRKV